MEFRAVKEHFEAGVRVITEAILSGVAVVDRAAYAGSVVEARSIPGLRMSYRIPYDKKLRCECCTKASNVRFEKGSLDEVADSENGDILAVSGNYKGALASRRRGSLRPRKTDKALEVEMDIADTQSGRDLIAQADDVDVLARPIVDFSRSTFTVEGDTAVISSAHVRGFILGSTDANQGWSAVKILKESENRRVQVWL